MFLNFAALLKRQGVNVKGLLKAAPVKEEPQPYIDCTGNLQVTCLFENVCILLLKNGDAFKRGFTSNIIFLCYRTSSYDLILSE